MDIDFYMRKFLLFDPISTDIGSCRAMTKSVPQRSAENNKIIKGLGA